MNRNKKEEVMVLKIGKHKLIVETNGKLYISITGVIQPINKTICSFNPDTDLITPYSTDDFTGFSVYDHFEKYIRIFKVSPDSTNKVELMGEYTDGFMGNYKKPRVFKYSNGVFTLGRGKFKLEDLTKIETINVLKAENFDIEATLVNGYTIGTNIKIDGETKDLNSYFPDGLDVNFNITTDRIIRYITDKVDGFAVLAYEININAKDLVIIDVDPKSKNKLDYVGEIDIGDLNIARDKIDTFSYDKKTGVFTVNDETFRIDDKINLLTTRRYVLDLSRCNMNMYITINGKTTEIELDECYFDSYVDLITPYSTDKFEGFAIFNTYQDDTEPTIKIMKVNNNGKVELIGKYQLIDYCNYCDYHTYPSIFEYDDVTGLFILDNVTYDMKKYKDIKWVKR